MGWEHTSMLHLIADLGGDIPLGKNNWGILLRNIQDFVFPSVNVDEITRYQMYNWVSRYFNSLPSTPITSEKPGEKFAVPIAVLPKHEKQSITMREEKKVMEPLSAISLYSEIPHLLLPPPLLPPSLFPRKSKSPQLASGRPVGLLASETKPTNLEAGHQVPLHALSTTQSHNRPITAFPSSSILQSETLETTVPQFQQITTLPTTPVIIRPVRPRSPTPSLELSPKQEGSKESNVSASVPIATRTESPLIHLVGSQEILRSPSRHIQSENLESPEEREWREFTLQRSGN